MAITADDLINQQEQALIDQVRKQYQSRAMGIDASAAKLPEYYAGIKNEAATTTAQNKISDAIRNASLGTNTGVALQQEANRQDVYGRAIASANKGLADSQAAYGLQKAQLESNRDADLSGITASTLAARLNQANADRSRQDTLDANNKQDILNTLGAYSGNYQKRINEVQSDGDTSNDWTIPYLQAAREDKIKNQNVSQAETMASIGDFSGYANLGYTPEQIAALQKAYQDNLAAQMYGGGGNKENPYTLAQLRSGIDNIYNRYTDEFGVVDYAGAQKEIQNFITSYGGEYASILMGENGINFSAANATGTEASGQGTTGIYIKGYGNASLAELDRMIGQGLIKQNLDGSYEYSPNRTGPVGSMTK